MNHPSEPDVTLINGLILTHPGLGDAVPHGKTTISAGRLAEVNAPIDGAPLSGEIIDCAHCLIMPGLINCHTHAAMSLLRGVADDMPLEKWLHDYIFPSEGKHADPDFVRLGTMLSCLEMALGGITTFADGYFFMEEAAAAAIEVGLRAVVAQGVLDVPAPDARTAGSWKKRSEEFLFSCPKDPLVSPALFCHSPYLCGPDTFQEAARLAHEHGALLFAHVCETRREVDDITARYGRSPVEHLENLGVLGPSFVAAHVIHVSEKEMDLLAGSGTKVVHCPESNMKLASGASPVGELIKRGIAVGIGTDGPASNNNLDLFEEMRSAALMAKLVTGDPESLSARTVLRMACLDAAKALGMEDQIGSLEQGKSADAIVIDLDQPHLTPIYDVASHLVYAARGSDVRDVLVNGRVIVRKGRVTTVDVERVKAASRAKGEQIAGDVGVRPMRS